MLFSALALLAVVQIADAQDILIPASQLRGSTNASIDVPVDAMVQNTSLPNMTLSAETAGVRNGCHYRKERHTISRYSPMEVVCNKGFDGGRVLQVDAKFRSTNNDQLELYIEIGGWRSGQCVTDGKHYSWDYPYAHGFQWKEFSNTLGQSHTGHFKQSCLKGELRCITPYHGHDECHVEVEWISLGEKQDCWGWWCS